ncbi:MAG: hypothetical protein OSB55_07670 [Verrucomicrobiota bacterium]|nr:hypothetical protein [Verrucomicrobiota bacterium]
MNRYLATLYRDHQLLSAASIHTRKHHVVHGKLQPKAQYHGIRIHDLGGDELTEK